MKKFLLKVSIFFCYSFLLQVVFPFVVDPFNVFHVEKIRANGIEPNKNYIKVKYILNNSNKFDGFMFGSSRVGAIHTEKITNEKIYNMTYSVGLPSEHLANIKTFVENGILPSKIYIGVDNLAYTVDPKEHIPQPLRCPYEYLRDNPNYFYSLYLNPYDVLRSFFVKTQPSKNFVEDFYEYGYSIEYDRKSKFDWNAKKIEPSIGRKFLLNDAIKDIQEISKICNEHEIELIIFTNPMYCVTYTASLEKNYFEFLERLAEITDFYNFSSLNDITLDKKNYIDTSHYNAYIGDMIIDVICNKKKYDELYKQGFGIKVTKENFNEFIALLKAQAK